MPNGEKKRGLPYRSVAHSRTTNCAEPESADHEVTNVTPNRSSFLQTTRQGLWIASVSIMSTKSDGIPI